MKKKKKRPPVAIIMLLVPFNVGINLRAPAPLRAEAIAATILPIWNIIDIVRYERTKTHRNNCIVS